MNTGILTNAESKTLLIWIITLPQAVELGTLIKNNHGKLCYRVLFIYTRLCHKFLDNQVSHLKEHHPCYPGVTPYPDIIVGAFMFCEMLKRETCHCRITCANPVFC